jgi:glycerophosphoryl diester phosphodiesterase
MLVIGHRGAKGLAPENTAASLQAALDCNVDGIEFDVRTSSDGVPVLVHNITIGVKGIDLVVRKTNFKDLKLANKDLLTLDEALRLIKNRCLVIIEIKPGSDIGPVIECLRNRLRNEWELKNLSISSFSFSVLSKLNREYPELRLIVNEAWSGVRAGFRAKKLKTIYITMNQRWLWSGYVSAVKRNGYKLSAYTINDPAKAARWARHGLYAVITDFPDRFSTK